MQIVGLARTDFTLGAQVAGLHDEYELSAKVCMVSTNFGAQTPVTQNVSQFHAGLPGNSYSSEMITLSHLGHETKMPMRLWPRLAQIRFRSHKGSTWGLT